MKKMVYDLVICGAGIAGISSAYNLSVNHGINKILILDERPPLSLTSDKSTECYRNWWPGPGEAMVKFMNRSIDLLDELADQSGNIFHLNRRGYLYVSSAGRAIDDFNQLTTEPSRLGAGPLRIHRNQSDDPVYALIPSEDFQGAPDGADLFTDESLIERHFPYLTEVASSVLHVRRAGWFSAQQLGMYLFDKARMKGTEYFQSKVVSIEKEKDTIKTVHLDTGEKIYTEHFINAAGPFINQVNKLVDEELPVYCELHQKAAFRDNLGVVPRHAPLIIWTDPQFISWSDDERRFLAENKDSKWLIDEFPSGVHARPEGGANSNIVLMLWEYDNKKIEPVLPIQLDPEYPEIALRGLVTMIPGLEQYIHRLPKFAHDGGFYTKTKENRPLICPQAVKGLYVIGALSGFGVMAACAAGELLAAYITKSQLPEYAPAFSLERYSDPQYLSLLDTWGDTGQL